MNFSITKPLTLMLWALLWSCLLMPTLHAKEIDPDHGFFIPKFGDWQNDAAEAKAAGKEGMFLFFEWAECPYCQKMRQTSLKQEKVQKLFNQYFAPIAVDIVGAVMIRNFNGDSKTEKEMAKHYRVGATPTLMLVDFAGKELFRHVGPVYTEKDMLALAQFLHRKDYQRGTKFTAHNPK